MKKIILTDDIKNEAEELLNNYTKYNSFSKNKEKIYHFTKIVGVKVCPYCNINYTYTVYNKKSKPIVRPDIDHFQPITKGGKEVELENLVPSCSTCNRTLKRDIDFSIKDYIHPYKDDFDSIEKFHISINGLNIFDENNFKIRLIPFEKAKKEDIRRAEKNINIFKLIERYQQHKDVVVDIFRKISFYNYYKQQEITNLLTDGRKSFPLDSLLFPEKTCDINKTSLGKLKKDIIKLYL